MRDNLAVFLANSVNTLAKSITYNIFSIINLHMKYFKAEIIICGSMIFEINIVNCYCYNSYKTSKYNN